MKRKYIYVAAVMTIILLVLFLVAFRPKDYSIGYRVGEYDIEEKYDKEMKTYTFGLKIDGLNYEVVEKANFSKRKLIKNVEVNTNGPSICVSFKSNKFDLAPVCHNGEEFVDASLLDVETSFKSKEVESIEKRIDGIDFSKTLGLNYAIWNHKGYYYINDKKVEKLEFLDNENYYNSFSTIIGQYVMTPNYDENYNFSSFYILNLRNGKKEKWGMGIEISFNSYYAGVYDDKLYLVDKKNSVEYEINPKKKKIEIISKDGKGKIWNDGWEEVSMVKLTNSEYKFINREVYNYSIKDETLYLNYDGSKNDVKVSDEPVTKIVALKNDIVFYLSKNKLYAYSPSYQNVLLATYNEWEFNDVNSIFVY